MNILWIIAKKKGLKKTVDLKREALKKQCSEQFEKLLSKGLSLPIQLL